MRLSSTTHTWQLGDLEGYFGEYWSLCLTAGEQYQYHKSGLKFSHNPDKIIWQLKTYYAHNWYLPEVNPSLYGTLEAPF